MRGRVLQLMVDAGMSPDSLCKMVSVAQRTGKSESLHATRVLIVEDDIDSGEALAANLEFAGYEVQVAASADAALERAANLRPAVAIIDIGLPQSSGYEVLKMLEQQLGASQCRYIAVAAFVGDTMAQRSIAAGFEEHLTKPLNLPALLKLLDPSAETLTAPRL